MADLDCPKCGAPQAQREAICPRCGIVFAKYWKYHPRPGASSPTGQPEPTPDPVHPSRPATAGATANGDQGRGLRGLLLPAPIERNPLAAWARAALLLALAVWSLSLIGASVESNAAGESFLHLINLPFHEAGHVIFRPFGEFITSLGGTLGQLLMPLIAMLVLLLKTRDPFGASVALWWFGQNFLDIAPYINDARAGQLPLLGGNVGHSAPYGFHDWEYLLTETGLLHMDHAIAQASHALGSAIMLLALGWGAVLVYRQLTWQRA
jgi:hypothetical protein